MESHSYADRKGVPLRRGYVDTPEGQVHYMEAGKGEPIMLLHQGPRSSRMYVKLMPLLAKRYRAIAPDMLGYGYSDSLPEKGDASYNLARNVVHAMDALKIPQCHLFGIHTGAVIAAEAAAEWPSRFATLILFGYPLIEDEETRKKILENRAKVGLPTMLRNADGTHVMKLWMRAYGDVLRVLMHTTNPPSDDFRPSQVKAAHHWVTPDQLDFMERWLTDALLIHGADKVYNSLYTRDFASKFSLIQASTLYIDPDSQYFAEMSRSGKRLMELIPRCEMITLPGSDENGAEFNPSGLAAVMLDYLRKHPL